MRRKGHAVIAILLMFGVCALARAESASALLEKGIYAEETIGDLDEAISIYEQIIKSADSGRASLAEAHYRLGTCYLKKGQKQRAAGTLAKLLAQFPDQEATVARARSLLDSIALPDPASLMPAETLFYMEIGSPGKQVETIVNMLKDTPFANPLAAMGGGRGGGSGLLAKSPEEIMTALLNPSMIEEFKKVRGYAMGIHDIDVNARNNNAKVIAVLYPGESDVLKGLFRAGLAMAGRATDPIEGMEVLAFGPGDEGGCAFDDNVIIVATPLEKLRWCVKQYKNVTEEPTLASANPAFASLSRQQRQESALTVWWDPGRIVPIIQTVMAEAASRRDAQKFEMIDGFADFDNIGEVFARFVIDEKNPFLEAVARLKEGYGGLGYGLFRTPNLTPSGFQAVPAHAVAVVSVALGEATDQGAAQVNAAQGAVKQLTGLDIGRELFDNIEQVTIFLLPPGPGAGESRLGRLVGPAAPGLGLAITSRDPQQTRQLLDRLLKAVDATISATAPGQPQSEPTAAPGQYRISYVRGEPVYCYVGEAGRSTVIAVSPETLDESLAALKNGGSALTAGPLKDALSGLPADTSKVILVNVGGAIRASLAHAAHEADVPTAASELLSQLADAFAATSAQLHTAESDTQIRLHVGINEMPPLGGVFPLAMQLAQAGGAGRRGQGVVVRTPASLEDQLRSAASSGDLVGVKALVERGADLNATDPQDGWTALHAAVFGAHTDVAEFLLERGARKDVLIAAGLGDWAFIEAKLAEDPSSIATVDGEGNTVLHWAERGNQVEMARQLLERGADPNIVNKWGGSPLLYAARASRTEIARLLVEHGAETNTPAAGSGRTPLQEAAMNGNRELAEILLAHGAQVNLAEGNDSTPLALATAAGHREIADLLRAHGGTE